PCMLGISPLARIIDLRRHAAKTSLSHCMFFVCSYEVRFRCFLAGTLLDQGVDLAGAQKINFRLNCSSRISIPLRVLVIWPKLPEPGTGTPAAVSRLAFTLTPGSPQF